MELWYTENHTENVRFSIKVKETLYAGQSPFQRIDVLDTYEFGKVLTIDGIVMITEKDEFIYHDMIVHTPLSVNPSIQNVLVIGGGDGGTVRELTRYPSIQKIDMVEIDEMVVRVYEEHFPITSSQLKDPRVQLYFEDGIKFVKDAKTTYDLIIVDSTDPIGPGEGLFTLDFYQDCFRILSENGILVNQNESPYYNNNAREMIRATGKLKKLFPVCEVYQAHIPTYGSGHWLFGFASKKFHPVKDVQTDVWNTFGLKTKYYNNDLHFGAFAIPTYVKEMLKNL